MRLNEARMALHAAEMVSGCMQARTSSQLVNETQKSPQGQTSAV